MDMEEEKEFPINVNMSRMWQQIITIILNILMYTGKTFQAEKYVKDISCVVYNFDEYVNCTWQLDVNKHDMDNIDSNVTWEILNSLFICGQQTMTSCILTPENSRNLDMGFRSIILHITLNKNGSSVANYSYDANLPKLVKPRPVSDLSGEAFNSTCVDLSWIHTRTLWGLKFRIEYSNQWDNTVMNDSVYGNDDSDDDITNRTICSLCPYTNYMFKVSTKPQYGGFWSESATLHIKTKEDVPSWAPIIPAGGFRQEIIKGHRNVRLFWQGLSKQHRNGENMTYQVTLYPLGYIGNAVGTETDLTTIMLRNLRQNSTYNVTIRAKNEKGESHNFSTTIIPSAYELLTSPSDVIVIGYPNITEVKWNLENTEKDIKRITVYWCQKSLHSDIPCSNDIQWRSISPSSIKGSTYIDIIVNSSYLFGVSVESKTGQTSGLQWIDCFVMSNNMHYGLKITLTPLTGNQLTVNWDFVSCTRQLFKGKVSRYFLTICKTLYCNVSDYQYIGGDYLSTMIDDTKPGETLCVILTAELNDGFKVHSSKICEKTYAEKQIPYPLIIVAGSIISVLFCLGVWFVTRQLAVKVKECTRRFDIETPDVQVHNTQSEPHLFHHDSDDIVVNAYECLTNEAQQTYVTQTENHLMSQFHTDRNNCDNKGAAEAQSLMSGDDKGCLTETTEDSQLYKDYTYSSDYDDIIVTGLTEQQSQTTMDSSTSIDKYNHKVQITEDNEPSQYQTSTNKINAKTQAIDDSVISQCQPSTDKHVSILQTTKDTVILPRRTDTDMHNSVTPTTEYQVISMNSAGYVVRDSRN